MKTSALAARTFNTYPISIGTSFAIEAFSQGSLKPYDESRQPTLPLMVDEYDEVWINLITLIRNMLGSVSAAELIKVTAQDVAYELSLERDLIKEIIQSAGSHLKVRFFTNSYKGLVKEYPYARLRAVSTSKQKESLAFTGQCISEFYKKNKIGLEMMHFDLHLKPINKNRVLLLSHYAHDLTSARLFESMDLLESHTGSVKTKSLWWTKFSDKRTNHIPMSAFFLQMFGDSTLFLQHDAKVREEILSLAEKHQWNYATGEERIKLTLNYMKDPYALAVVRKML